MTPAPNTALTPVALALVGWLFLHADPVAPGVLPYEPAASPAPTAAPSPTPGETTPESLDVESDIRDLRQARGNLEAMIENIRKNAALLEELEHRWIAQQPKDARTAPAAPAPRPQREEPEPEPERDSGPEHRRLDDGWHRWRRGVIPDRAPAAVD